MKFTFKPLDYYDFLKSAWLNRNFKIGFNYILLAIIPLIFLMVWFLFNNSLDSYYYTMMDPEYAYLINGIAVIENHGRVDYIDHPGTTLEIFIAGTIGLIHIFRDDPLMDDVLKNPELYLKAVNVALGVLLIVIMLFAGIFVLRKTRNLGLSLLVQATPMLFVIPHFMARVIPETLAILLLLILIILIISYIESIDKMSTDNKYTLYFSINVAILLATKISMSPLFFIPLFLLKKAKKRLVYFGLTVIFFLLFAYPVLLNFNGFFQWIKSLFLHSGRYGSGDANILSVPDFIQNLKTLYASYHLVFYLLFVNLGILLAGIFLRIKNKALFPIDKYNAIAGLTLCYVFQILMISKHFSLHYFLPSLMMVTLNIYLIIAFLSGYQRFRYARIIESSIYLLAVIAIIVHMYHYVKADTRVRYESMHIRGKTTHFVNASLPEYPVVFNSGSWNPRQEVAIWFGSLFAKRYRPLFVNKLNEIYPDRYFYVDQWECYIDWYNNRYKLDEIVDKHDSVYFIYNRVTGTAAAYLSQSNKNNSFAIDTLYSFAERSENITMLKKIK